MTGKVAGLTVVADIQINVVVEMLLTGEVADTPFGKGNLVVVIIAVGGVTPAAVTDAGMGISLGLSRLPLSVSLSPSQRIVLGLRWRRLQVSDLDEE
ncbi:hypothetical protein FDX19_13590 [Citrobacter sp. wls619]|uniref:hypothetical protein n=1 Tax=Citrobacter sp. wls619 TaxID=2576432 RepID=UPI0010C945AE|nr:hypothetical protein [Citrobacter sp. wls619]TKV08982.1 hypothetical protein FDX19_13590 [Citrobacter sp. wls619]